MFTAFGVTAPIKKPDPHTDAHHHDSHTGETSHSHPDAHTDPHHIDVDIHDDHDHETDVGQIAVDILDTPTAIIIVAPIA
jgi:hypothetical protein